MASKFKQFIDELIYGHEPEPEKAQEPEQEQGQEQGQDRDWLDEEIEKQRGQEMPDAAYAVSERDEPAPEVQQEQAQEPELQPEPMPEHEPAQGELTPGQSDIQHDGLQQDGNMDRETMNDGLDQGGMDEIEM